MPLTYLKIRPQIGSEFKVVVGSPESSCDVMDIFPPDLRGRELKTLLSYAGTITTEDIYNKHGPLRAFHYFGTTANYLHEVAKDIKDNVFYQIIGTDTVS